MCILSARLPPEIGSLVRKAIEVAESVLRDGNSQNVSAETPLQIAGNERRADALRLIAETFLSDVHTV